MKNPDTRIAVLDGWRGCAVLGVLWWHAWIDTGNPALQLGQLNLQRLLAPLGNGVDLFFILSGLCITLALGRETRNGGEAHRFTPAAWLRFIGRRWVRLSPAFIAVSLVTYLTLRFAGEAVAPIQLVSHATWLFGVWPGAWALASTFWSLQVEWEFYLLAPLLLWWPSARWRAPAVLGFLLAGLVYRALLPLDGEGVALATNVHLPPHAPGFALGMLLGLALLGPGLPGWTRRGWVVLSLGLGLVYAGRGASSTEAYHLLGAFGPTAKALGLPIMSLGFTILIVGSLAGAGPLHAFANQAWLRRVGSLSYALYLWHWWPSLWIGHALRAHLGASLAAHYLTLAGVLAVCLPLAWPTLRWVETPVLAWARRKTKNLNPPRPTPAPR